MQHGRTIIVGAGGFGRELINWADDCHRAGALPPVAGLIDDDSAALDGFAYEATHLGSIDAFAPEAGDMLLMAIGTPALKQKIAGTIEARGGRFATMVHPTAVVAASARIAPGSILCPLSLVSADAHVGRFSSINALSSVGHDVRLGDYSTLSAHVDLTGAVVVGERVMIGTGAKLLPRVKVGADATIGAGAVVYRNVPEGGSVFSQPAKLLRTPQRAESASR